MYYTILDGKVIRTEHKEESLITVSKLKEGVNPFVAHSEQLSDDYMASRTYSRFESYDGFDLICINHIHIENLQDEINPVYIIITNGHLDFYSTDYNYVISVMDEMKSFPNGFNINTVLFHFMMRIIRGDLIHLEDIGAELRQFESEIFDNNIDEHMAKKMLIIKKHLMKIEMYYELLLNLVADLSENRNGFYSKSTLKKFSLIDSKLDRLYSKTNNLLSYASEVWSTYQSQVDLELNKTMKILTIITVIVSPLTLIVGWYGMNLQMPEFHYQYSYPIIIALCIVIVVGSIIFFKKKKWFWFYT